MELLLAYAPPLSGSISTHVLDKIRKNIFFGFIDYFYHIIDLLNRKFYL